MLADFQRAAHDFPTAFQRAAFASRVGSKANMAKKWNDPNQRQQMP
jgi:hypothetical protein